MDTSRLQSIENYLDRLSAENAETARLIRQNQKQLGELGNKLGSFAEGLAYPTVERIMSETFGMTSVSQNQKVRKGGEMIEIDVFGYANGATNTAIVGEIKSHFRESHVEQLEEICGKIREFMPEHRGKKIYGMVIFVNGEQGAINRAIKRGFYVVQSSDENFKLITPENFEAKNFG